MATGRGNLFQRTWRGASDDSRALGRLLAWTAVLDLAVFLALLAVLLLLARASVPHVLKSLLPGVYPPAGSPPFKHEVIAYVLTQLVAFGSVGCLWLWKAWRQPVRHAPVANVEELPAPLLLNFGVFRFFARFPPLVRKSAACAGLIVALSLAGPFFYTWYPPTIPNDFFEANESLKVQIDGKPVIMDRAHFIACIDTRQQGPACPASAKALRDENSDLLFTLRITTIWKSELGRIFFHHSYVMVPAAHFLKYGLDRTVPYLYGYGNTITQALVMAAMGGVSLSNYFAMLPVLEFAAMLSIALLAGYITRSWLAAGIGGMLALCAFYSITYDAVFLAASYNPTRYLGIELQIASMFFAVRGRGQGRLLALPLAAAFSCFWNIEFATMGGLGQILVLLSPSLPLTKVKRLGIIALTSFIVMAGYLVLRPDADIIGSVWLGFYHVGVPPFGPWNFRLCYFVVCAIEVALCLLAASYFKDGERDARIAIVGVLALVLVKWIFNSSPANLSYSNILALPVMLAFLPWRETLPQLPAGKHRLAGLVQTGILVIMLPYAALQVRHELQWKYDFDHKFISHYAIAPWRQLGERLPVITPEAPILERVEAIRREIKPGEKMLIISPFDQLTSFYVNPAGFCGHFEVISNLTTTDSVKAIAACVKNHALVVMDSAIDMPCPVHEYEILGKNPQTQLARKVCPTKEKMKRNAALLLKQMGPLKKVGEQGPLSFYRS